MKSKHIEGKAVDLTPYPHGMAAVHADVINRDLLDFLRN